MVPNFSPECLLISLNTSSKHAPRAVSSFRIALESETALHFPVSHSILSFTFCRHGEKLITRPVAVTGRDQNSMCIHPSYACDTGHNFDASSCPWHEYRERMAGGWHLSRDRKRLDRRDRLRNDNVAVQRANVLDAVDGRQPRTRTVTDEVVVRPLRLSLPRHICWLNLLRSLARPSLRGISQIQIKT